MVVGIQLDCRLKNVRISISIAPLKTRPMEKAASAPATTVVWCGVNSPRWYTRRTIGSARTAEITLAGISVNAIWRKPRPTVFANPRSS